MFRHVTNDFFKSDTLRIVNGTTMSRSTVWQKKGSLRAFIHGNRGATTPPASSNRMHIVFTANSPRSYISNYLDEPLRRWRKEDINQVVATLSSQTSPAFLMASQLQSWYQISRVLLHHLIWTWAFVPKEEHRGLQYLPFRLGTLPSPISAPRLTALAPPFPKVLHHKRRQSALAQYLNINDSKTITQFQICLTLNIQPTYFFTASMWSQSPNSCG